MGDNGFHSIFFVLRLLCLFVAINRRFQDKYLLGGAMSCSGNLARAFSPHFVFQFVTWSVYVFSAIAARAKERGLQSAGVLVREGVSGILRAPLCASHVPAG